MHLRDTICADAHTYDVMIIKDCTRVLECFNSGVYGVTLSFYISMSSKSEKHDRHGGNLTYPTGTALPTEPLGHVGRKK